MRASWVIGCDGGSSTVRSLAGIELDDLGFDEPWLVVDVHVNARGLARLPTNSVQYCEPERPCTMVIGPGNHRRWEISLMDGEDPRQVATPEGTWALLSRWLAPDEGTLWRQSSDRFRVLVAKQWRVGRVFIAGDAAHMQPPFLGQGMCQGVRGVANLAWKLAAVWRGDVAGRAANALLDSYGTERSGHVRSLTGRLKAAGAIICERDPAQATACDARLLVECGGVVQDTARQDVLPRLGACRTWGVEAKFGPSEDSYCRICRPIALAMGQKAGKKWTAAAKLQPTFPKSDRLLEAALLTARDSSGGGTLFPQPRLASGALMDQLLGTGWRLMGDGQLPMPAAPGLTPLDLGQTPEAGCGVAAWMARHDCHAALLRPHHYVYGTAADAAELTALLADQRAALGS